VSQAARSPIFETDADDDAPVVALPPAATVMWVHDRPVCVTIIHEPQRERHDGACRCGGCHASRYADWAEDFL
jgi:hypothetical protein